MSLFQSLPIKKLTIATRQSPLALWQAEHIKAELQRLYSNLQVDLLKIVTKGDKILDTPLAKIGGKGLFVKELEQALYQQKADIAVHSLKDVPMLLPEGLTLGAYCTRAAPTDAFVSNHYDTLDALPKEAVIGTSSLRRQCQIKHFRNDLNIKTLRGNVGTRLSKLDAGEYDAIILATSGLQRIGFHERIKHELDTNISLPAVGQGALAIECRADDATVLNLLAPLNNEQDKLSVLAERAFNRHLEGGCQVPIAGFATLDADNLCLRGRVGQADGSVLLKTQQQIQLTGTLLEQHKQAEQLGIEVAKNLIAMGAKPILESIY